MFEKLKDQEVQEESHTNTNDEDHEADATPKNEVPVKEKTEDHEDARAAHIKKKTPRQTHGNYLIDQSYSMVSKELVIDHNNIHLWIFLTSKCEI